MDNYIDKFKTKTNSELMRIITRPNEYKPDALQIATEILESRNLTPKEIDDLKEEVHKDLMAEELVQQRKVDFEDKVKVSMLSSFVLISPLEPNITNTEKIVRIITILLILSFLYSIFNSISYFQEALSQEKLDEEFAITIFSLLLLPLAIMLFHQRKKMGWTFFSFLLAFLTPLSILNLIMAIRTQSSFDSYNPFPSPSTSVSKIVLYGGLLSLLCLKGIRNIYSISKTRFYLAVVLPVILTFLFLGLTMI